MNTIENANREPDWSDRLLMLLLLLHSGNPFPVKVAPMEARLVALAVLFLLVYLRRAERPFTARGTVAMSSYFAVLLIQCFHFDFFPLVSLAGFFLRVLTGFYAAQAIRQFSRVYMDVVSKLCVLSLVLFGCAQIAALVGLDAERYTAAAAAALGTTLNPAEWSSTTRYPLLLQTFVSGPSFGRNAGMFWEPGAFAGYVIVALALLCLTGGTYPAKVSRRYVVVFAATVVTTLSTMGYMVCGVLLLGYLALRSRGRTQCVLRVQPGLVLLLAVGIGGAVFAYRSLPFLHDKVSEELTRVRSREGLWHRGRLGAVVFDLDYIERRPLTGWGLHSRTRFALHSGMTSSEGMGNGFSDFAARLGLIGLGTWGLCVLIGFWRVSGGDAPMTALAFLGVVGVLQGECFLDYVLFHALAFLRGPECPIPPKPALLCGADIADWGTGHRAPGLLRA